MIALKNPTVSKSATAGTTKTYATFANVWAHPELKKFSTEGETHTRIKNEYNFTVRHSAAIEAGLSKDTIITYDGNDYQVTGFQKLKEFDNYYKINTVTADL